MSSVPAPALPPVSSVGARDYLQWFRRHSVESLLLGTIIGLLVYFFVFHKIYMLGSLSAITWAMSAWTPENDLEHGGFIFPAALLIAWYHRQQLWDAPKSCSWLGLFVVFVGAVIHVAAVRTLQPRLALMALPLLTYGSVRFLWGKHVARIILFPALFLFFMVPLNFLVSRTVGLQTLAAGVAAKLSSLLGIGVISNGTELKALNGAFQFEVAGGCSGIRSLTAMTMLSALYVHFFEKSLWKKVIIFAGSLVFALIGNLVRIFSVVLFAHFISPTIAAGIYHDYSGFIFFPIAVFCMLSFANLLNKDWRHWITPAAASSPPTGEKDQPPGAAVSPQAAPAKRPATISYDY